MSEVGNLTPEQLKVEMAALSETYNAYKGRGLTLDMSRGKPSSKQMDLSLGLFDEKDYIDSTGVDARNYGFLEGLPEARQFFSAVLGLKPEEVIVGGNSSLQLMYSAVDVGAKKGYPGGNERWNDCKGKKFLCPVPGYDRHFTITQEFGFELINVPMTQAGPDMDIVEELVKDPDVKGIWCVPVYSNPDGYVYSDETVKRLASMEAAAKDFRIFWDNAYGFHHLNSNEKASVLNIMDECRLAGNENRPLIFISTSKITFAGAGVACIGASKENIEAICKHFFSMLISFDKVNQLRHIRYFQHCGGIDRLMEKHAEILQPKFKIVDDGLAAGLSGYMEHVRWTKPKGGYFISLYLYPGCAKRVVSLCKEAGVVLTGAGAAFPKGHDPDDCHIRIAPTFPVESELETAVGLLCTAVKMATVEKLLEKSGAQK